MLRKILTLTLLVVAFGAFSQKVKKVTATYSYVLPKDMSQERGERTALERAKTEAIADEFGTLVSKYGSTTVSNENGKSTVDFSSIGGTEVRGEWIETTKDPVYTYLHENGTMVISVTVEGKIREIPTDRIDIKAMPLRNGTEERYYDTQFREGDDLYMLFQSPVKGNLLVYLVDEREHVAYQILPYREMDAPVYRVNSTNPLILFSPKDEMPALRHLVDEYRLTAERSETYNSIYVIFSPEPLTRAIAQMSDNPQMPKQLRLKDFRAWLGKVRAADRKLNVETIPIKITKQ